MFAEAFNLLLSVQSRSVVRLSRGHKRAGFEVGLFAVIPALAGTHPRSFDPRLNRHLEVAAPA
jgi:hypothetical protein